MKVIASLIALLMFAACTKFVGSPETPRTRGPSGSPFSPNKMAASGRARQVAIVIDVKSAQESAANLPAALIDSFQKTLARLNPRGTEVELPLELAVKVANPGTAILNEWAAYPAVVGLADEVEGYGVGSNDPAFPTQRAIQPPALAAEEMIAQFEGELGEAKCAPVTVAVIDSGADTASPDLPFHPDLVGTNMIPGEHADRPLDDHGHGTAVASILGATRNNGIGIAGIASCGTKIIPIRAFDKTGKASTTMLVNAFYRAANMGADIAVLAAGSFTEGCDPALGHAISRATDKGVAVFISAGNHGRRAIDARKYSLDDLDYASPACWGPFVSGAVSVGATGQSDKDTERFSLFSNYGEGVEVSAPGVGIVGLRVGGGTSQWTGTSFSAPLVAGVATHIVSYLKAKNWAELGGTARHLRPQYVERLLQGAYRAAVGGREANAKVMDLARLFAFVHSWNGLPQSERLGRLQNPRNQESWDTNQGGKYVAGSFKVAFDNNYVKPNQSTQFRAYAIELETGRAAEVTDIVRCTAFEDWLKMTDWGQFFVDWSVNLAENQAAVVTCHLEPTRWQHLEVNVPLVADVGRLTRLPLLEISQPVAIGREHVSFEAFVKVTDGVRESALPVKAIWTVSNLQTMSTIIPGTFDISRMRQGESVEITAQYDGLVARVTFVNGQPEMGRIEVNGFLGHEVVEGQTPKFQAEYEVEPGRKIPVRALWYVDGSLVASEPAYVIHVPNPSLGVHRVEAVSPTNSNVRGSYNFEMITLDRGVKSFFLIVEKSFANRATFVYAIAEYESRAFKAVTELTQFSVSPNDGFVSVSNTGAVIVNDDRAVGRTYTLTGTYGGKSNTATIRPTTLDTITGRAGSDTRVLRLLGPDTVVWGEYAGYQLEEETGGRVRNVTTSASWSTSEPAITITGPGAWANVPCSIPGGGSFQISAIYDGIRIEKQVSIPLRGAITDSSLFRLWGPKNQVRVGTRSSRMALYGYPSLNINNERSGSERQYRSFTECIRGRVRVSPPTGLPLKAGVSDTLLTPTDVVPAFGFDPKAATPGTYTVTFEGGVYRGNGIEENFVITERIEIFEDLLVDFELRGLKIGFHHGMRFDFIGYYSGNPSEKIATRGHEFEAAMLNTDRSPAYSARAHIREHMDVMAAMPVGGRQFISEDYILKVVHKSTGLTREFPVSFKGTNHFVLPAMQACPAVPQPATAPADAGCNTATETLLPVAGGNGTQASPFLVCNANQLRQAVRNRKNFCPDLYGDCHFKLGRDLDLSEFENWEPVMEYEHSGRPYLVLDGANHTVSNLVALDAEADDRSFLGYCSGTKIRDLHFEDPNIRGDGNVGTLCGKCIDSQIESVQVRGGNLTGTISVGGICGTAEDTTMKRVYNLGADIHAEGYLIGGLVGYMKSSRHYAKAESWGRPRATIQDSISTANILSIGGQTSSLGGLVGGLNTSYEEWQYRETVDELISRPDDFATEELVRSTASIYRSCWIGTGKRIEGSGESYSIGGVVGSNEGILFNVAAEGGSIVGNSGVGGIVGDHRGASSNAKEGSLLNSRATNLRIFGSHSVGGAIGNSFVTILQSNRSTGCRIETTHGAATGGFIGALLSRSDPFHTYQGRTEELGRSNILDNQVSNEVYSTGTDVGGFVGRVLGMGGVDWLTDRFDNNTWSQNADPNYQLSDIGMYGRGVTETPVYDYPNAGIRIQ